MNANININLCKKCAHLQVFAKYGGGAWILCPFEEAKSRDLEGIGQLPQSFPYTNKGLEENAKNLPIEHIQYNENFKVPKACPFILEHLYTATIEK